MYVFSYKTITDINIVIWLHDKNLLCRFLFIEKILWIVVNHIVSHDQPLLVIDILPQLKKWDSWVLTWLRKGTLFPIRLTATPQ